MFKKIKLYTHENVGSGRIHLPEEELHTTAYWLVLPQPLLGAGRDVRDAQAGLLGLAQVLVQVAPLFLMCDPRDLGVVAELKSPHTSAPTIYLFDKYPGGVGLSPRLYDLHERLLAAAAETITRCGCAEGCPSCVGPRAEMGPAGKTSALAIALEALGKIAR
jgi:DEAD/DEAH box helicase domain-containing protein